MFLHGIHLHQALTICVCLHGALIFAISSVIVARKYAPKASEMLVSQFPIPWQNEGGPGSLQISGVKLAEVVECTLGRGGQWPSTELGTTQIPGRKLVEFMEFTMEEGGQSPSPELGATDRVDGHDHFRFDILENAGNGTHSIETRWRISSGIKPTFFHLRRLALGFGHIAIGDVLVGEFTDRLSQYKHRKLLILRPVSNQMFHFLGQATLLSFDHTQNLVDTNDLDQLRQLLVVY